MVSNDDKGLNLQEGINRKELLSGFRGKNVSRVTAAVTAAGCNPSL